MKVRSIIVIATLLLTLLISGCSAENEPEKVDFDFRIISGSENEPLEPIIEAFAKENKVKIEMVYKGSVDMMNMLSTSEISEYDGVWPANSMWITIGDTEHKIKNAKSIMTSPIVFGVRKDIAENLGFTQGEIRVNDILEAINSKKLNFIMTSATQSNSGACAYLGFLSALLGNPDTIKEADLEREDVKAKLTQLLAGVDRSSGSSGWLKDLYLSGNYDAMVNYEAVIIEANQELLKQGKEPLYAIYPVDGLAIADSPLGYVDNRDARKAEIFAKLQDHLLSADIQKQLSDLGRRTGLAGVSDQTNPEVFNKDWGIDGQKVISGITMPSGEVIKKALGLYQSELRKPSATVYCLDYSGSMSGQREKSLKSAMAVLLDQQEASKLMIQSAEKDVMIVVPFSSSILDTWEAKGNKQETLNEILSEIQNMKTNGGTDIYTPALKGIEILNDPQYDGYSRAVVLLTDGESNAGMSYDRFAKKFSELNADIPVFAISFGDSDEKQLDDITTLTRARVFDGKQDLSKAFQSVKGYN